MRIDKQYAVISTAQYYGDTADDHTIDSIHDDIGAATARHDALVAADNDGDRPPMLSHNQASGYWQVCEIGHGPSTEPYSCWDWDTLPGDLGGDIGALAEQRMYDEDWDYDNAEHTQAALDAALAELDIAEVCSQAPDGWTGDYYLVSLRGLTI